MDDIYSQTIKLSRTFSTKKGSSDPTPNRHLKVPNSRLACGAANGAATTMSVSCALF